MNTTESILVRRARLAIQKMTKVESEAILAQAAVARQAKEIETAIADLVRREPKALAASNAPVPNWVGYWAHTGLPYHGRSLPDDIMQTINR